MQRNQIYKCSVCGNIIELEHVGGGQLHCCGQPMNLQEEKSADQGAEKHVPIIETTATGVKVTVGSIPHPMEETHYIEWIEVQLADRVERQFLKPGQAPEVAFSLTGSGIIARAYCNLHGLWVSA